MQWKWPVVVRHLNFRFAPHVYYLATRDVVGYKTLNGSRIRS